jgi:hypothetical protein
MEPSVVYGLQVIEPSENNYVGNVFKITTDETGVWVDFVATFEDKEAAHAFIRSWNGEETPS